jgi:hypothetical protein
MKTFQFLVAMAVIVAVGGMVNPAFAGMKSGKQPTAAASRTPKSAEKSADKVAEKTVDKVTEKSVDKASKKAPRKAAAAPQKKEKQGKKARQDAPRLETGKTAGDRKKTG